MAPKTASSSKASKKTTKKVARPSTCKVVVETAVVENTPVEVAEDNYDQEFATVLDDWRCSTRRGPSPRQSPAWKRVAHDPQGYGQEDEGSC